MPPARAAAPARAGLVSIIDALLSQARAAGTRVARARTARAHAGPPRD
jgi:hypothetical protein